jgi:biopolymer transport protein ExbD
MARRYFEGQEPRLNIIPMIDIMMFLLVFFVLAVLHMIPDNGIKLHLPSATTATVLPQKNLIVSIQPHGKLRYQGHDVTLNSLENSLGQLPHKSSRGVILAVDKNVHVNELMKVMDAIRALGITRIGIATHKGKP